MPMMSADKATEFVESATTASARWVRHALAFPCRCQPEAPGCDDGLRLFAAYEAEQKVTPAPDALEALGEARSRLEAAIAVDPTRAGKGSVMNAHGLGGVLRHVEFAIAELTESMTNEELELEVTRGRDQGERTAREPADSTAASEGS